MAEAEIIIPLEMLQLVDEQQQIVREAATFQSKIAELERIARQIPTSTSNQVLSPLTEDNTPISELNAVLKKLPDALARMQQLEARWQQQRSEMQQTQFHALPTVSRPEPAPVPSSLPQFTGRVNVMLWLSAGIVIVIVILLFLLHH